MDDALVAYLRAARDAWPELEVDEAALVAHVSQRAIDGAPPPVAHAGDLYLACACALGVPGAVDAFDRAYGSVIARVLARRRATPDLADDAAQTIRERLFVAAGDGAPKIAEYAGTGPLRSWVSTVAATTALMANRAAARRREESEPDGDAVGDLVRGAGPDLLYLKERYKADMAKAVIAALGALGDRDRTLLRLQLSERMSIDRIGAMYRVDRSTAARWLAAARDALIAGARRELKDKLGLDEDECDSMAALVRSELHVSIVRLLG